MKAYVRLVTVLGFTGVLATGAYFGLEAGWGRLRPVEIELDPESDQQHLYTRIRSALERPLRSYQGRWLWDVNLEKVMADVEHDRRVQSVRISRKFPNRLIVTLTPHRPVLAWVDEVGRLFPVAADASLLPAQSVRDAVDVPLLRGQSFRVREDLREKAIALVGELPETGPLSLGMISEITYSEKNGFSVNLIKGGLTVRLGDGEYGRKARRVEQVLNYLQDQQLKGRVIDARFAKKVVVRLRNDP